MGRDQQAFDDRVGIAAEEVAILERAWFPLCGVRHDVPRGAFVVEGRRPLRAGRETGATSPSETRTLDGPEDGFRAQAARLRNSTGADCGQVRWVGSVGQVGEEAMFDALHIASQRVA